MKLKPFILAITAVVLFAACRKAEETPAARKESELDKARTIELTTANKEWRGAGDDRDFEIPSCLDNTVYGTGVFYRNWKDHRIYGADYSPSALIPTRQDALSYKLDIPEDCAKYSNEWFAVNPYFSNTVSGSLDSDLDITVFPVQQPADGGIDPVFNFVVSKPFQAGLEKAEATAFKRMVSIVDIRISGLKEGEKIYAATMKIEQSITKDNAPAGIVSAKLSGDFNETAGVTVANPTNSITAIFPEGLQKTDGSYSVRYATNRFTAKAGSTMTMTVTTADSTYTCSNVLDSEKTFNAGETGTIDFNIKGDGYTKAQTRFEALKGDSVCPGQPEAKKVTADGSAYTITVPALTDVSSIKLFSHVQNGNTVDGKVNLVSGEDVIATVPCNADGTVVYNSEGGSLAGMKVTAAAEDLYFTAAVIYTETKPVDMNDYLDMYNAGLDITIGDRIVNKESCGAKYVCLKPGELTAADLSGKLSASGVIFLDNSDSENNTYTNAGTITFGTDKIVIGRYKNLPQPSIVVSLAAKGTKYFYASGDCRFLNVTLSALNTTYGGFVNTGATDDEFCINCQDCTLCADIYGMFRLGTADHNGFKEIVLDNCIVRITNNLINASSGGLAKATDLTKLRISNCAITTYSGTADGNFSILNLNTNLDNAEITLNGNTIYGFSNSNGLLYMKNAKSITIENNLIQAELSADRTIVKTSAKKGTLTMENNYGHKSGDFKWAPGTTDMFDTYTPATRGSLESTETFFDGSMDAKTGYFPSLIPGAGCSYDTKYWFGK